MGRLRSVVPVHGTVLRLPVGLSREGKRPRAVFAASQSVARAAAGWVPSRHEPKRLQRPVRDGPDLVRAPLVALHTDKCTDGPFGVCVDMISKRDYIAVFFVSFPQRALECEVARNVDSCALFLGAECSLRVHVLLFVAPAV